MKVATSVWHAFTAFSLACFLIACDRKVLSLDSDLAASETADSVVFTDVSNEVGLSFLHHNGSNGNFNVPEILGAGGALIDFDNDGDLDIYVVQGGAVSGSESSGESGEATVYRNLLFRSLLIPTGALQFEDATSQSGGGDTGYGMGVASGDYDNDGDVDLYVMNLGDNILYRNENGVFLDVTIESGTNAPEWSAGGTFFDYDHDGDLDLFVTNYLAWQVELEEPCRDNAGQRDYCGPAKYPAVSDRLFRNNGDGTFADVSTTAGISANAAPGLGVVAADFDGNGLIDIYVANDGVANHLWLNQGDGSFEEAGLRSGSAYNAHGKSEAGMGVAAADFDSDGDEDVFVTHLTSETNTLYRNDGKGNFEDVTERLNLGAASISFTGFGTGWLDVENDSQLDLFVANGTIKAIVKNSRNGRSLYAQTNQLFSGKEGGDFRDASAVSGAAMSRPEVSRGAAFGDVDNDGDVDIVVTNNNGPARLLRNDTGQENHWLRLRLIGKDSPRDAQGTRIALSQSGTKQWRRVHSDGSYASASDVRVLFGLGNDETVPTIEVFWPSGLNETWRDLAIDMEHVLQEGSAKKP